MTTVDPRVTSSPGISGQGSRPKGLLVVWFDVPPELNEEFSDWHNTEHLPERQSIPGILSARRFIRVGGDRQYVAMYDLEDVRVLESPAYLRISGVHESPWSRRIRQKATRIVRNVYEQQLPEAGGGVWILSPNVQETEPLGSAVLLVPEDETEPSENRDTGAESRIRGDLATPGFRAARRFVALEGRPRYLTIYELDHGDVPSLEPASRPGRGTDRAAEPAPSELRGQQYWRYTQVFPVPKRSTDRFPN